MAKVAEPTACFSMASLSFVGGKAGKVSALVMALPRVCMCICMHHALWAGIAKPSLLVSMASFTKFMIQFIFLWLWFQVWECVRNQ